MIDGLLYHESELNGFNFAPRIRDFADKRLYVPGNSSEWPALERLIRATINLKLIEQHFDHIWRLAVSIKQTTATASLIL